MAERDWRAWIRQDVTDVRPLGSYAAKLCPVRTQLDVLRPGDRAGVSAFLRSLGEAGRQHEVDVIAGVLDDLEILPIAVEDRSEAEAATLAAMQRGEQVITGGRLPTDTEGRRVGEPDVLVRIGDRPADGRWRYAPVDIKSHATLRPGRGRPVVVQSVDELRVPDDDAATSTQGRSDGTGRGDALQLAHYHRMLEACGHATDGAAWAAIVGSEGAAAWFRLDEPRWSTPTADPDLRRKERTSLEVYDFEFGFRLDIAACATRHLDDPDQSLLVVPVDNAECPQCPWRNHCWPVLDRAGDVSRLPGVDFAAWRALGAAGLGTIEALAASDVARIADLTPARLDEARRQARARLADAPASWRAGPVPVPTADVEVDLDMENILDGAYLWGALVTVRRDDLEGVTAGHRSFATWQSPLDEAAIATVFGELWSWLGELRRAAAAQGARVRVFCWNQSAENRHLRLGGAAIGESEEVERFIASDQWVDLLAWWRECLVTGHGNSLKDVARLLGFAWRDDDPGGATSMTWYAEAVGVDAEAAAAARDRLVAYNEDDCRATRHVRDVVHDLAR